MKDFEFYKTIRLLKNKKISKVFAKLHNTYHSIPDTKGCMDNIAKEGASCNGWSM